MDVKEIVTTFDFRPFEELVKEALNAQSLMCKEIASVTFEVDSNNIPICLTVMVSDKGNLVPCRYFPQQSETDSEPKR